MTQYGCKLPKAVDKKNLGGTKYYIIDPICTIFMYQLFENACLLIVDTQAYLSALELGQKL